MDELLSIPEDLGLYKSKEEKQKAKQLAIEARKTTERQNRPARKAKRDQQYTKLALQKFEEFQQIGNSAMAKKYGRLKWRRFMELFRQFVPEYHGQQHSSKKVLVTFLGKTQCFSSWLKEL